MKVESYTELNVTDEDLEHAKDVYTCSTAPAHFVYCGDTIYEVITKYGYRHITHEDIITHFKLDNDKCWRLIFEKEYPNSQEFGIDDLELSYMHRYLGKRPELSKQDLDNIESYILFLKEELKELKEVYDKEK